MLLLIVKWIGKIYFALISYTSRVKVVGKKHVLPFWNSKQNVIYALWHSRVLFLVAYGRYGLKMTNVSMIVSRSRDGEYIARIIEGLGFLPVRGSSSNGGSSAFSQLFTLGKDGKYDVAVTPDGPRGPREVVKPGIIELARKTGLSIIPAACSSRWQKVFNSWDRFLLPFPFSKAVVIFGQPLKVKPDANDNEKKDFGIFLADTLKDLTKQADEMVKI